MDPRAFQTFTILQWWFFNVLVIIMNKYIFQIYEFKFPLTLTTVHFVMSSLGAYISIRVLHLKPLIKVSSWTDLVARILPVAGITCLNIVLGNISLRFVPVSFMQTIKCFTPFSTVLLQRLVWGKRFDTMVWVALIPIVFGVAITTAGELSFDWIGFLAAVFACFTTSTSNILAEVLLQGKYTFDSINTVYYMAPLSIILLAPPALFFESASVTSWITLHGSSLAAPIAAILGSGLLAFFLNFSLFYVIQATSAVTFNVAGNLKVALAIVISWMIFRNPMSTLSWVGCTTTIVGCSYYGYVQHQIKARVAAQVTGANSRGEGDSVQLLRARV